MALFKKDRGNAENQSAKDPQAGGEEFPERNQGSSSRENKGMAGTGAAEQRSELGNGRETALLGKGTRISGKLSFEGMARIEGEVEGEIVANGTLMIGASAVVNAQITATNVVIHGNVTGDIRATKKLEIRSPAKLFGNVITPSVVIEEGVVFEGHCSMGASEERGKKVTLLAGDEKPAAPEVARAKGQS